MFALEIDFHDGISPPETILVRRANAIIGSSDLAHVVIEGAASSACELRLARGLGREFSAHPVKRRGHGVVTPSFLEGSYQGEVELKLGDLGIHVTALDVDLSLVPDEFYDRAAIRVLRTALTSSSATFPAAVVLGARPIFVSFPSSLPLLVGRSRNCGLRLDATDVSAEHARLGVDGGRPWVEDLGSTNGTFVGDERVSGRRYLEAGERVKVGAEFVVAVVLNEEDVLRLNAPETDFPDPALVKSFPCVVSSSTAVRPGRFPIRPGITVRIGRDPANDIWISSAHISRSHVELSWEGEGQVQIVDYSSNGTYVEGERLEKGVAVSYPDELTLIDLCSGVILGVCHNEEDERRFFSLEQESVDASAEVEETEGEQDTNEDASFQPDEDVRRVLERAAGISEEYSDMEPPGSGGGVFAKLAERQANRAQIGAEGASEYFEAPQNSELEGEGIIGTNFPSEDYSPLSDFERYQQEQRLAADGVLQLSSEYNLLSEEEFDEDLLESPQFGGVSRALLAVGVVTMVIFVVFVCIVLFSNNSVFG